MAKLPDTPEAKFTRGEAKPGQAPKGEAQALNEGVAVANEAAAQNPAAPFQELPVQFSPRPEDGDEPVVFGDEKRDALFGPTNKPDETMSQGRVPLLGGKTPPNVGKWLRSLEEAAADEDAPEVLKNMHSLILYHLRSQGY